MTLLADNQSVILGRVIGTIDGALIMEYSISNYGQTFPPVITRGIIPH